MNKKRLYWILQIVAWTSYAVINIIGNLTVNPEVDLGNLLQLSVFEAVVFFGITHIFRSIISAQGWLNLPFSESIPRMLILTFLLALPVYPLKILFSWIIGLYTTDLWDVLLGVTSTNAIILFIWVLIYFIYHYFDQYNRSLKYEAAMKEIELANLRSQLNPHFIFNALNSIRALVDEEPKKSKVAITQLSNILRSTLVGDKRRLTKFEDEFSTVRDYLELETTRYEERLHTEFDIHPSSYNFLVPPLMLQTLVENGIKHGISNLKEGGVIKLKTFVEDEMMHIQIRNSGQVPNGVSKRGSGGFGIPNTKQRLKLIFGDDAYFNIFNENDHTVLTIVKIPQIDEYESINN